MQSPNIILASSSVYRQRLFKKLQLAFTCVSPDINETLNPDEKPNLAAIRLASEKAGVLADRYPEHLIIGSDQIAVLNGKQLKKPGNRATAITQLRASSGKSIEFFTGLCLLHSKTGKSLTDLDKCTVYFRQLSVEQIEHYVDLEKPYACSGGFKAEGLGIALFERIVSHDPNSLIGLPLIKLVSLLNQFGVRVI